MFRVVACGQFYVLTVLLGFTMNGQSLLQSNLQSILAVLSQVSTAKNTVSDLAYAVFGAMVIVKQEDSLPVSQRLDKQNTENWPCTGAACSAIIPGGVDPGYFFDLADRYTALCRSDFEPCPRLD